MKHILAYRALHNKETLAYRALNKKGTLAHRALNKKDTLAYRAVHNKGTLPPGVFDYVEDDGCARVSGLGAWVQHRQRAGRDRNCCVCGIYLLNCQVCAMSCSFTINTELILFFALSSGPSY